MDQQARERAFIAALPTEHFVVQSTASTTVSEISVLIDPDAIAWSRQRGTSITDTLIRLIAGVDR